MQEFVQTKEKLEAEAKKILMELHEKQAILLEKEDVKTCSISPEGKEISQEEIDVGSDPSYRNDEIKSTSAKLQAETKAIGVRTEQGLSFLLLKLDAALGQTTTSSNKESFVPETEGICALIWHFTLSS